MWIKIASRERKLQSPEGSFVSFEKFVFVKTQAVRGFKRTRIVNLKRMWIKIASRERKLQSPEGSFVSFEKFVFVKTQAVRGLKEHESC